MIRKAPPEHARDYIGKYRKGNDGNMWFSSPTAKRWVRVNSKKIHVTNKDPNKDPKETKGKKMKMNKPQKENQKLKKYNVIDNGGITFCVYIESGGKSVSVYKVNFNWDTGKSEQEEKPCQVFHHPKDIFVGKSPLNEMTQFSGGHGRKWNGNSILLHLSGLKYVFIGMTIQQFEAKSPIVKYVSPVGNNGVPYPFAIDEEKRFYFMIQNQYIDQVPKEHQKDPYDYLYGHFDDKMGQKAKSKWQKKWPSMKMKTLVKRNI